MSEPATAATTAPAGTQPGRPRIRAQAVAHDPDSMRFLLDTPLDDGRSVTFDGPDESAPLAQALFAVPGVARVHAAGAAITVTRAAGHDWSTLKPPIAAAVRTALARGGAGLGPPADDTADEALLTRVQEVLDRHANPAIAAHGGQVDVVDVQASDVHLRMSGGCQGCAASAATLREGVERMLRAALPEIGRIVDVTDHAAGTDPYFTSAEGAATVLERRLPPGIVTLDGAQQVLLDPDHVAPRLGLAAADFRAALRSGAVVAQSETGTGPEAEHIRVVLRGAGRAWAAELMPDGSAREVPPPRAAIEAARSEHALCARLRRHLNTLPDSALPITYGQLARALGLILPGAVRRVTAALETTMREDAAAGRPFLAALVVGRGRARLPGRGFFDLARELGRGPAEGEDDAAFHAREMRSALAARVDAA